MKPTNQSYYGLNVIESPFLPPVEPKLALSPKCPVSDEFRERYNQWAVARFGWGEMQMIRGGSDLYVPPGGAQVLKKALEDYSCP